MRDDDQFACDCLEQHLFADDPRFPQRFERLARRYRHMARLPLATLVLAGGLAAAVPAVPVLLAVVELLLLTAFVQVSRSAGVRSAAATRKHEPHRRFRRVLRRRRARAEHA